MMKLEIDEKKSLSSRLDEKKGLLGGTIRMDGWMDGWWVLPVHPLVVVIVVVFLVSCFFHTDGRRRRVGRGSGDFGWFFRKK
jgi:hypothetical protein